MSDLIEKHQLRMGLKRLYQGKYRERVSKASPSDLDCIATQYERESAPLRGRLAEIESSDLVARAMSLGIVVADLAPLRFGSPLWREEAGYSYLSAEGKQAVDRAIKAARRERFRWLCSCIGPLAGLIGALTGLMAVILR